GAVLLSALVPHAGEPDLAVPPRVIGKPRGRPKRRPVVVDAISVAVVTASGVKETVPVVDFDAPDALALLRVEHFLGRRRVRCVPGSRAVNRTVLERARLRHLAALVKAFELAVRNPIDEVAHVAQSSVRPPEADLALVAPLSILGAEFPLV